jgi:hypothetical protein
VQLCNEMPQSEFFEVDAGLSLWTFFGGLYGHVQQTFHTMTTVRA